MKTRFAFIFALLFPLMLFAQGEHLTFMGIPLDGTLDQFTTKLTKKGFSKISEEKSLAALAGDFAGYKECVVIVSTLNQKDLVYSAAVIFPPCNQWSSLESNYFSIKNMLTTKYGEPVKVVEEFQGGEPNSDNSKFIKLQLDECNYKTGFETENGRIFLALAHEGLIGCYVILGYVDNINEQLASAAAINDL